MRIFSLPLLDPAQLVQSAGFFALQDYKDYIPENTSYLLEPIQKTESDVSSNIERNELITSTETAPEISTSEHSHDTLLSFEQNNPIRSFRKSVALTSATSIDDTQQGFKSFSTGSAPYDSEQNLNSFSNAVSVGTHLSNVLSAATVGQAQFFNSAALETYTDSLIGSQYTPWGVSAALGGESLSASSSDNSYKHAFVIDSGVSRLTGDLNLNTAWSKSWLGTDPLTDIRGHGTHVAGTIAALDNDFGVIGVAPGTQITSLQVLDQNGSGSLENVQLAIEYAVDTIFANNINLNDAVINLSLTANGVSRSLDRVIKNAADRGVRFSIAAGNFGADVDGYSPATTGDHANVYVASAVDSNYQMASWSNWDDSRRGDDVDFAAAGVNVLSYYTDGQLAYLSGTSMAAPHLAGQLLLGDIVTGDYVLASSSGYADPFALSVLNTNPTDPTTTLSITSSASEIAEGDQISFDLLHSGSAQQTYYWSISGDVDLDDFVGLASLKGQADVAEGISSELVFVTKSNDLSEPIESLSFAVFSDSLYQDCR